MNKFTIKDLSEGRCAVINDGTVEELNKVLRVAFPNSPKTNGSLVYYYADINVTCNVYKPTIPVQSVKDFLEELEKPEFPKKGDRILVSDKGNNWREAIFVTYIEGALLPIMCVYFDDEYDFKNNKIFRTVGWKYWKPISEKKVIKVTMEEIAEKFDVDEVEIID